jgi:hypothetical protein
LADRCRGRIRGLRVRRGDDTTDHGIPRSDPSRRVVGGMAADRSPRTTVTAGESFEGEASAAAGRQRNRRIEVSRW